MMHHIIKKQIFNLLLGAGQDAFYLQHRISNYNQQKIILILQKIFDEMCANDESIYIDRLEIDLDNISVKEIQNDQWADLFEAKLKEKLNKISGPGEDREIVLREPQSFSIFRQWLFSMNNGYLPWNAGPVDDAWYKMVLESIATDHKIADELRLSVRNNKTVTERIILQHAVSFLISLAELLTAEKQDKLFNLSNEFFIALGFLQKKSKQKILFNKREIEIMIWKEIFNQLSFVQTASPGSLKVTAEIITERLAQNFFSKQQIKQLLKSKPLSSKLPITLSAFKKAVIKNDEKENNKQWIISEGFSEKSNELIPEKDDSIVLNGKGQKSFTEDFSDEFLPTDKEKNKDFEISKPGKTNLEIVAENEIFVQNAGVILVHPFLSSFFKILGYVHQGKFVSNAFHHKALYLIHFLATGNTEAHEHDLVIAKIICAFPLDEPVDNFVEFSERELQEAGNLLSAAIASWEILKSTSVEGLREGFLQRPGKLQVKNGELYLQLETNSIDVLLDHLPWNLSIIKLPWMENILRVEWR
jgi:contractile injection system tape measure protein